MLIPQTANIFTIRVNSKCSIVSQFKTPDFIWILKQNYVFLFYYFAHSEFSLKEKNNLIKNAPQQI